MKSIFNKFIFYSETLMISRARKGNPVVTLHIISPKDKPKFSWFCKYIIVPLYILKLKKLFCKWKFIPSHMYIGKLQEDQFVYEELKK